MLHGPVARTLSEYADDNAVDLIVMTTRGRQGFSRWLMGSVADQLLRHVRVPVLLLHPREHPLPIQFRRILVAMDGDIEEPVATSAVALGWLYPAVRRSESSTGPHSRCSSCRCGVVSRHGAHCGVAHEYGHFSLPDDGIGNALE
jgi:hypothetical protein